ncbi:MAG: hypothetical protein K2O07_04840, partial [Alistipes sp.]|nr:hypothetical protein [Alistipes sp.]
VIPLSATTFFVKSGIMQRNAGGRRWAVLAVLPIGERQGAEAECRFSRKRHGKVTEIVYIYTKYMI